MLSLIHICTAQKIPRADLQWVISFIGHAPADDPKFAIYSVLDEPDGTTGDVYKRQG